MYHARLKYTNYNGAGFYKFTLNAGSNVAYPEYAIQVYTDADRNNLLSMYSVNELNILAQSNENENIIKKCDLNQIIKNVIKKNQDSLLYQNIAIRIKNIEATVLSDSKWLEFIINQIISNSIKYHGESDCLISFNVIQNKNHISLEILDNGIGIKDSELPYVFDKSFTGENGRLVSSATGMGLYIVKNLCHKLGHQIAIESKQGKYTKVIIDFNKEDYYKVVR